ncbi:MAG: lysophospholipid acyltransferase family protein [Gammaproteobacteria bacterium]
MRVFGSVLLALWLAVSTPVFSLLALLSSPLPPHRRYQIISQWSRLLIFAARVFCGIRHRVIGMENLPAAPCVLLSRHESAWETVAYQTIFPPQAIVLKKELLRIPFFGPGLARMSPIAINRADGRRALREVVAQGKQRLADGFYVLVFPEGTRMQPRESREYHIGGAFLANKANCPAVPVAVDSGKYWPKNGFFKRAGLITVRIGPPIDGALPVKEINRKAREWIEAARRAGGQKNKPRRI